MDDDIEPHARVIETTKFAALAGVAARLVSLNAQAIHMPGHRIDLSGQARYPERVDHVPAGNQNVDGSACRHMQDAPCFGCAMIGRPEIERYRRTIQTNIQRLSADSSRAGHKKRLGLDDQLVSIEKLLNKAE